MWKFADLAVVVALSAFRIEGDTSQLLQAAAHLYVGFKLGMWWAGAGRWHLTVSLLLSVVETVCFGRTTPFPNVALASVLVACALTVALTASVILPERTERRLGR